eukprot:1020549-Prorocentrum_lima.AAC.1
MPGTASYMSAPMSDLQTMSDAAFSMTLRRRLLMPEADMFVVGAPTLCSNAVSYTHLTLPTICSV